MAMSDRIEVPLDTHLRHDLDAMLAAIRPDTTVVYVCNPNNPSGTIVTTQELADFVEAIPERVLVLIDEAYEEFVTDPDHSTALPLAVERPNVMVVRTFSKVHGLASLRVGYGVSTASTIALESLRHPEEIAERIAANAAGREFLERGLAHLGVEFVPSQANFVYFRTEGSTESVASAFLRHAIILRPFGEGWVRVSVGTPDENRRFLGALAKEQASLR
jgi:histidinol-phosphate aminotransferase